MSNLKEARKGESLKGTVMSDELITEQAGYRTTKEIVEGFMLAGKRLQEIRMGQLDNYVLEGMDNDENDYGQDYSQPYQQDMVDEELSIKRKIRLRSELKKQKEEEESGKTEKEKEQQQSVEKKQSSEVLEDGKV